jgi:hypothetical protein
VIGYLVDITGCDRCRRGVQMVQYSVKLVVAVLLAVNSPVNELPA